MMNKNLRKSIFAQLRFHMMSSYFLLICVITILLGAVAITSSYRAISKNAGQFLQRSCEMVTSIEQRAKEIALNAYVAKSPRLFSQYNLQNLEHMMNVHQLIKREPAIHSVWFYDASRDVCFVFGSYCVGKERQEFRDAECLDWILSQSPSQGPYAMQVLNHNYLKYRSQVYTIVYYQLNGDALVLHLKPEILFAHLANAISTSGTDHYMIIGNDGQVLYSDLSQESQDALLLDRLPSTLRLDGRLFRVSKAQSSNELWSVILLTDWTTTYMSVLILVLLVLLCLPAGFLISLLLNRRISGMISQPYVQIVKALEVSDTPLTSSVDDVMAHISSIKSNLNTYRFLANSTIVHAQKAFLMRCLQNAPEPGVSFCDQCRQYQLPFFEEDRLLLLYVSWYATESELDASKVLPHDLLLFALSNVFDELCTELRSTQLLPFGEDRLLMMAALDHGYTPQRLEDQLVQLCALFREHNDLQFFFGVCDPLAVSADLSAVCKELTARYQHHQFFHAEDTCAFLSQPSQLPVSGVCYFTDFVGLKSSLCDGSESYQEIIRNWFLRLREHRYDEVMLSLSVFHAQCCEMYTVLAQTHSLMEQEAIPRENVFSAKTLNDCQAQIFLSLDEISQQLRSNQISVMDHIMDAVLRTMQDNYNDCNLSAKALADAHRIAPARLNQLCNQKTGKSVMGYLKEIRLSKACELLTTSTLTVEAIAASVGYENSKYFHTVFKAEYGLTPSRYRLLHTLPSSLSEDPRKDSHESFIP